jgi:glucose/sorbosone dehydrogenase
MDRRCRLSANSTSTRIRRKAPRVDGILAVLSLLLFFFVLVQRLEAQTPQIALEPTVTGLSQPVYFTTVKDGTNRRFVVEQTGQIRVLQPGSSNFTTFLDISSRVLIDGESGLLGLAFHPQFSTNRRFFVDYTRQPDNATVIAEFRASATDPNIADPTQTVLLTIPQPTNEHKGGMLEFGPDGQLYIGVGDGGPGDDPQNRAQNLQELLGKILRLDVDRAGSAPTIFAYGFRNPWRFSFDRLTGQIYAGDVGQDAREEVDIVTSGGNYGWRIWEGTQCTNLGPTSCSAPGFIPPIIDYEHTPGDPGGRCAVIGGYVYRGTQGSLPSGAYIFGDLCSGEIFMLKDRIMSVLLDTTLAISSFGEDQAGEIYVVNINGSVFRLTNPDKPTPPPPTPPPPTPPPPTPPPPTPPPPTGSGTAFSVTGTTFVRTTAGNAAALATGYARVQAATGSNLPSGLAIFGFRSKGTIVSETSVPISPLISSGRIFAEVGGAINTAIAIVNPNNQTVGINFFFTDSNGRNFGEGSFEIPANQQVAAFLNQDPFNGGNSIFGTLSFSSSGLVAAIALRGVYNERSEFLMTTLPVVQPNVTTTGSLTLPHFADGGGWRSQVVLINPVDSTLTGSIQFLSAQGQTLRSELFSIAARSVARFQTDGTSPTAQSGSVRVSVVGGILAPAALSIFTYRANGITVSTAGAAAMPDRTLFVVYGELAGTIRTGLAVANPSEFPSTVTITFGGQVANFDLPANGQKAFFLNEIPQFASLSVPQQGVISVSGSSPITVTGIRGRTNERGDFLITTTAAVNPFATISGSDLVFPYFADGAGYSTQFILFGSGAAGTMYFSDPTGQPKTLSLQ